MTDAPWSLEAEERLRPYAATGGRTESAQRLGLSCLILTTPAGRAADVISPEARDILAICSRGPRSVAEVAARIGHFITIAEILLGDLLAADMVTVTQAVDQRPDADMLRRVLDGLRAA